MVIIPIISYFRLQNPDVRTASGGKCLYSIKLQNTAASCHYKTKGVFFGQKTTTFGTIWETKMLIPRRHDSALEECAILRFDHKQEKHMGLIQWNTRTRANEQFTWHQNTIQSNELDSMMLLNSLSTPATMLMTITGQRGPRMSQWILGWRSHPKASVTEIKFNTKFLCDIRIARSLASINWAILWKMSCPYALVGSTL